MSSAKQFLEKASKNQITIVLQGEMHQKTREEKLVVDDQGRQIWEVKADLTPVGGKGGVRGNVSTTDSSCLGHQAGEVVTATGIDLNLYEMAGRNGFSILAETLKPLNGSASSVPPSASTSSTSSTSKPASSGADS